MEINYAVFLFKFGSNERRPTKIVRSIYGLQSSGSRLRDSLVSGLHVMQFKIFLVNPDGHMIKAMKPNIKKYWECFLCCVDDVLVISPKNKKVKDKITKQFSLILDSAKELTFI